MTPDIEKLAREAGIEVYHDWQSSYESETVKRSVMEHLYALIRAQVLEEAARVAEQTLADYGPFNEARAVAAIRALKQP
jgi:hypothetical protein